ncbi:hypothetical protein H5J25_13475 [Sphingomonas aliaeris]|uniref:Uncharacterized protein n=1 Tax=Sphingomonas aliaeris TaxID=2759526 RepID=A0A974S3E7_9SPHN|nr:hypothetical protein [Sphingomonas aliaeris]QQV76467.1 hypothetical protein H5J25_13475 [Sphingomonas aliaeris]
MAPDMIIREYHDRRRAILSILDIARPDLNRSALDAWPAIAVHRQKLSDAMQTFQQFKHANIFDPIIAGDRNDKMIAAELKADCVMLGNQYDTFRRRWTSTEAQDNWPKYRLSAIAMMTTIRKSFAEQDATVRTLNLA